MSSAPMADAAFELFVKKSIQSIQKDVVSAWGKEGQLRDACAAFLTALEQHESGAATFEGSLAVAVLQPLGLACASSNPKVVEAALGCLHKLVAHAWLHGESSNSAGLMEDGSDVVALVIKMVVRVVEMPGEALQLATVRALLTFTTAEHFVAHGDSLMAAVRAVFNLALGSDSDTIKRTAGSALLQMLNTVAKRITCDVMASFSSLSVAGLGSGSLDHPYSRRPEAPGLPPAASVAGGRDGGSGGGGSREAGTGSRLTSPSAGAAAARASSGGGGPTGEQLASDARTAQFASMAEHQDLRGLEVAIESAAEGGGDGGTGAAGEGPLVLPALPDTTVAATVSPARSSVLGSPPMLSPFGSEEAQGSAVGTIARVSTRHSGGGSRPPHANQAPSQQQSLLQLTLAERDVLQVLTAFCKLASRESGLTEVESFLHQGKLLALELLAKVLGNPQHAAWHAVRDEFCRQLRAPLCITLLRNCSASDSETFMRAIKLLATVVLKPKLRGVLKAELGAFYPLYILRPLEAGRGDLRTLSVVLSSVRLVCGEPQLLVDIFVNYDCDLQAPCLFERTMSSLSSLSLMTEAGMERLSTVAKQIEQAQRIAAVRDAALKSLLTAVSCLEAWAQPIRDAYVAATAAARGAEGGQCEFSDDGSTVGSDGGVASAAAVGSAAHQGGQLLERLEAAHSHKSLLAKAVVLFNASPAKGVRFMLQQRLVPGGSSPAAVAAFLREHAAELGKGALGEYFGRHDDLAISVMHAWVDAERSWAGIPIDSALRLLLEQFRLPGEAQKIDRIMEKFAERYVRDNPGRFASADGAYMLAFAIIMLNTDVHNPLAERRLSKSDFIAMNSQPVAPGAAVAADGRADDDEGSEDGDDGGAASPFATAAAAAAAAAAGVARYEPVLPQQELEAIYDRVVLAEIKLRDDTVGAAAAAGTVQQQQQQQQQPATNRLAAALGMRASHFRPVAGGWRRQQQGLSDADRKRKLVQLAERAVLSQGQLRAQGAWFASHHAEHARPMLTVAGGPLLDALTYHLTAAASAKDAEPVLATLVSAAELAAVLGLEDLAATCVSALAGAAGLAAPAPQGSPAEGKQLAALRSLLGLAASPVAGLLGSGWTVLLHAAAALDALAAELAAPSAAHPVQAVLSDSDDGAGAAGSNPFNKMFQALSVSLAGASANLAAAVSGAAAGAAAAGSKLVPSSSPAAPATIPVPPRPKSVAAAASDQPSVPGGPVTRSTQAASPSALKPGPGMGLVLWGLTDGHAMVEKVYSSSTSLDGEAVVVFFRALCAVSRDELDASSYPSSSSTHRHARHHPHHHPSLSSSSSFSRPPFGRPTSAPPPSSASSAAGSAPVPPRPARLYSLQRLLDCAHANAGRIRLIRSKLWAVTSAHLVMVACHPSPAVAAYAVNALHGLAQRLLAGAEPGLAAFAQQEEALRPFVNVMRVCDEPEVRRLTVRSAVGSCAQHCARLGSGWRTLLEVLVRAAGDASGSVVTEALGALTAVVGALYHSAEQQQQQAAAVEQPTPSSTLPTVAEHGSEAVPAPAAAAAASGLAVAPTGAAAALSPAPSLRAGGRANSAAGASSSAFGPAAKRLQEGDHGYFQETVAAVLAAARNASQPAVVGETAAKMLLVCGRRLAARQAQMRRQQQRRQQDALDDSDGGDPAIAATSSAPEACWASLLSHLADWSARETRASVAEAASVAVLQLLQLHGADWGPSAWQVLLQRVVPGIFNPAAAMAATPASSQDAGAARTAFAERAGDAFIKLCGQLKGVPGSVRPELLSQLSATCLRWFASHSAEDEVLCLLGLRCFEELACQLAAARDVDGVRRLLSRVSALVVADVNTLVEQQQGHQQGQHQNQNQNQNQHQHPQQQREAQEAPLPPPALARRVLLMLRLLTRVQCELLSARLPWQAQAQLAALLVSAAQRLLEHNLEREAERCAARDATPLLRALPGVRAAAAAGAAPAAGAAAQMPPASSSSPSDWATAAAAAASTAVDNTSADLTGSGPLTSSRSLRNTAAGSGGGAAALASSTSAPSPQQQQPALARCPVVLSSRESRDEPLPCLGRLESEAAAGALDVLLQCRAATAPGGQGDSSGGASAPTAAEVAAAAAVSGAAAAAPAPETAAAAGMHSPGRLERQGSIPLCWVPLGDARRDAELAAAVAAGPEQLLGSFCLHLIQTAAPPPPAPPSSIAAAPSPSPFSSSSAAAVAAAAARRGTPFATAEEVGVDAALLAEPWHLTLRAANLAAAIQLYLSLPACEQGTQCVVTLWPNMVALISCPHAQVRQAVAGFFQDKVGALLATPPAQRSAVQGSKTVA